ncbi:hypothetical protein CAOG_05210 [Capsaspora owczarzaki ATCC 30864]|uniref:Uncharacterized protein n=1 Tax=Capsaspora owczarzaki (strain ATCC 30864) TaxID=595528 RepID=A0A0D2X3M8_CAPO3|nr:hypothetical protein CAOG_05210 [Capsaspora owczarzaki ATCC 30864]KJE94584.1 hypothetical protein CAOG_005210 [Capsaspora owczarzaki ATCC 30864]|eukprot:XP_004346895.1 hypothetical protein CAOG_05210 [Capsaspora owczarzaki ATCC 30864]
MADTVPVNPATGGPAAQKKPFTLLGCGLSTLTLVTGVFVALLTILCGVITCIGIDGTCLAVGIYMVFFGVLLLGIEAPVLFNFSNPTRKIGDFFRKFKHWHRAILIPILTIVIFFCIGVASVISIVLLLLLCMLHVFTALGPRGQDAPSNSTAVSAPSTRGYKQQADLDEEEGGL